LGVSLAVWQLFSGGNARADTKFEFGPRLGYALPFGNVEGTNDKLKQTFKGEVPIWFDAGARIADRYFVGAYLDYNVAILSHELSQACDTLTASASAQGVDVSCGGHDVRFGGEFMFHVLPKGAVDPWLGAGVGYEWLTFSIDEQTTVAAATLSSGVHGFEFANLQLGLDVPLGNDMAIGPFLAFTLAEFARTTTDCSGYCTGINLGGGSDLTEKKLHEWLFLGARATFEL
jgi:hypothetical protein